MDITERLTQNRRIGRTARVDRLILHHTGGGFDGALNWTMNPASQVSYHYMINRFGRIWRTVREQDTAWHAASWNPRSIGICGETNGWTTAARDSFVALMRDVCRRHGIAINRNNILGHGQVMSTACPGSLPINDWVARAATPVTPPPQRPAERIQGGKVIVQHPTDRNRIDVFWVGPGGQVQHRWATDGSGMHAWFTGGQHNQNLGGPIAPGTLSASWNLEGTVLNVAGVSPTDRQGAPDGCGAVWGCLLPIRGGGQGQWRRLTNAWGMLPEVM